tara:strand:- start:615 stop:890 length:276 start_codon:yes stop_codon:yes gene_type:complete
VVLGVDNSRIAVVRLTQLRNKYEKEPTNMLQITHGESHSGRGYSVFGKTGQADGQPTRFFVDCKEDGRVYDGNSYDEHADVIAAHLAAHRD